MLDAEEIVESYTSKGDALLSLQRFDKAIQAYAKDPLNELLKIRLNTIIAECEKSIESGKYIR